MKIPSIILAAVFTLAAAAQDANRPSTLNGKLVEAKVSGTLKQTLDAAVKASASPAWIGYAVPTTPRPRFMCCFDDLRNIPNSCCSGCKLESGGGNYFFSNGGTCVDPAKVHAAMFVMLRAEQGKVSKLRQYTPNCALDLGGLTLTWIDGVDAAESVRWLGDFAKASLDPAAKKNKASTMAMDSIALHQTPESKRFLAEVLDNAAYPAKFRQHAAFWLSQEKGRAGYERVRHAIRNDKDDKLREDLTFAISQSREEDSAAELVRVAKQDASPRVRSQALFWMAQKASGKAAESIAESLENDPDSAVRKKAVFALSQLPKDEGVPLLIKYARGHKDPVVRKEALFWLGQSGDPRAIDLLEEILLGKKQ